MGGHQHLGRGACLAAQLIHRLEQAGQHGALPAGVQVGFGLVKQNHEAVFRFFAQQLGRYGMFVPGPHQKVHQRQNAPHPGRGQSDRNRLVTYQQGRAVTPFADEHALRGSRPQGLLQGGHDLQHLGQGGELRLAALLPVHPIALQPFTHALSVDFQPVPHLVGLEVVSRRAVGVSAPVVARRVPHRKAPIDADVHHDARHHGPGCGQRPAGVGAVKHRLHLGDPGCFALDAVGNGGLFAASGQGHRPRPGAGQGPPGQV